MTEWLDLDDAVELIRGARKLSVGAAVKLLIEACAEGVRARQRPCWGQGDIGFLIPAAIWRDAHLDTDTGELYPAGTDPHNPPTEEGGYGYGGNGIIEINEADLRAWLREPVPGRRGRPPMYDWEGEIKRRAFEFLNYHGAPSSTDPEWGTQAALEKALRESGIDAAESTLRSYAAGYIDEWKAEKVKKAEN